ncbi:MAG: nucleoside 2-deoxyribosyltransferase [Anaerolineales bacterium]
MKSIYIAGPLFNKADRSYLEHIAEVFEKAGFKTFLPHRDVGVIQQLTPEERARIFYGDLRALDQYDICVALLTGPDHDSGTCAELGYCYAKGKLCFGITDDIRWLNNFIWGLCNDGKNIVKYPEDLLEKLT